MTTTSALKLPGAFELSYENFESYPEKLVCPTSYPHAIKALKARLDALEPRLFTKRVAEIKVVFRDLFREHPGRLFCPLRALALRTDSQEYDKWNIFDDAELKELLGDRSAWTIDPQTKAPRLVGGALATKVDPKCRFM
jgi:hypothetical protein